MTDRDIAEIVQDLLAGMSPTKDIDLIAFGGADFHGGRPV